MDLKKSIQIAEQYLGEQYFSSLNISFAKNEDLNTFKLCKEHKNVVIEYGQLCHIFRALTLIKEKCNLDTYSASFTQKLQTNGLMLDCSRNGVMKNDRIKEMILICSLMGHNRLLIYTEDTFNMDKYPYFGYLRGAYSKEDIKEFVEYGESFGVELVPCVQTLGHLKQALKWQPMENLKDGPDTLLVDSPEVYTFIEDMIKFAKECFKSKNIHIGMDESFEMGLNRHILLYGYQDRTEMFVRHLLKVKEICEKYDFSPMIWSDMFFRLNNQKEEYYGDCPLSKETLQIIPKDVQLVYWDYYHKDKDNYLKMLKFHKEIGNQIIFASGSWRWIGFAPSISNSINYTKSALEACLIEGVKDTFVTAWGDDGNECSFFTVIPTLATSSIMNYGDFDLSAINSLTKAISGDEVDDFCKLDLPNHVGKSDFSPFYNPSKYLFYQDVLLGLFDLQINDTYPKKYSYYAVTLCKKAKTSDKYGYIYDNLSKLCYVLETKTLISLKLRTAYKNKDYKTLKSLVNNFDLLITRLDAFHDSLEKQWMIECRPFGYEVLDGRLGFLKNRIIFAKKRIVNYLGGSIDKIEELETKILPFDGKINDISWNWWYRNISPSH